MSNEVFEGRVDPYSDRIANPLTVQLFEAEDCGDSRGGQWHQWRACSEDIEECTELPYSVKSFRTFQIEEGNNSCLIAAEEGEESKGSQALRLNLCVLVQSTARSPKSKLILHLLCRSSVEDSTRLTLSCLMSLSQVDRHQIGDMRCNYVMSWPLSLSHSILVSSS